MFYQLVMSQLPMGALTVGPLLRLPTLRSA